VALLRALGFPATLATGLGRLTPDQLRELDAWFDVQDFEPGPPGPAGPTEGEAEQATAGGPCQEGQGGIPLTLALLGWSPRSLAAQPPQPLSHAVEYLTAARTYLGLRFTGVMAWQLSPGDLANLRFRLAHQDRGLIKQFLQERADSLVDFERLAGAGPAAPGQGPPQGGYVAARAELLAALADDRTAGGQGHRVRRARGAYEEMVQRDLIAPLREWALESTDPVIRNAGTQLADVSGLLHQLGPLLADLQAGRFERARGGDADPVPGKTLTDYLALTARLGSLMRDLDHWMRM
jgi:hypothetical protein